MDYDWRTRVLADRILELIPEHPQILIMADPWPLFKIKNFVYKDLDPTLFQASFALAQAKARYYEDQLHRR